MEYEIWTRTATPGPAPYDQRLASFVYFQEALDYVDYAKRRGETVVLRKPLIDHYVSEVKTGAI